MCRVGIRDKRRGYVIEIVPLERTKLHIYTNLLSPHVHHQFHRLICTHLSTSGPGLVAYALYI